MRRRIGPLVPVRLLFTLLLLLGAAAPASAALSEHGGLPQFGEPQLPGPEWLSERYEDGTVAIRYPEGWIENDTDAFGHVLSDNKSQHPAFVGIRYLPERTYADQEEFAQAAVRALRPPDGVGTSIVYTQAAVIGDRRGTEVAIIWQVGSAPVGPLMRVYGIELESGEVALLTFAAERHDEHQLRFAWIKREIRWT